MIKILKIYVINKYKNFQIFMKINDIYYISNMIILIKIISIFVKKMSLNSNFLFNNKKK